MPFATTTYTSQQDVPVTIVRLAGELDGTNYMDLVDEVRGLYSDGARDLLLDLSHLTFMSSSGLVALHTIALIMRGGQMPDEGIGWSNLHAIANDIDAATGTEVHFKILNPQPRIQKTLDTTGFSQILEVLEDEQIALQSFQGAG
jgi:anti-anti-sigma regulatory factor